jgi:prepilin signal peptidase PulO-like enzyme (type II secretory pathway)
MRKPYRLFRELGFGGFLAFQLIVGGNALVALVHPIFMLRMIFELLRPGSREEYPSIQFVLYLLIIAAGYLLSTFIGCFGLARRRHAEKGRGSYSDPAALAAAFDCSMVGGR